MERSIALGLDVIFLLTVWCIFASICILELRGRGRKIARASDDLLRISGHKPVLLYSEFKHGTLAVQVLPFTFGCVCAAIVISILSSHVGFYDMLGILSIFFIFLGLSIWPKVAVTLWVRTLFIATNEGIYSVRLRRKRHKVVRSILWSEVTSIYTGMSPSTTNLFYTGHSLFIDSARSRIKVAENMENLEPFFQIIRMKVSSSIVSNDACLLISKPISPFNRAEQKKLGTARLGHSKLAKAITIIIAVVIIPLLFYVFFLMPDMTAPWMQVVAVAFMLLPIMMLADVFLSYYVLSDEGIERHRFHVSKVFIPWDEVRSVKYVRYKYAGGAFRVYGTKDKIELEENLDGIVRFGQMVVANLPPEIWSRAKMNILDLREQ